MKAMNSILSGNKYPEFRSKFDSSFLVRLVDELEKLLKSNPVPPRSRDLNSEMISAMHLQHLREKTFLVETLLLTLDQVTPSMEIIEKIFKIAKKNFFLLNTSSSYLVEMGVADKLKEFSVVLFQIVLIKLTCHVVNTCTDDSKNSLVKLNKIILNTITQTEERILVPLQLTWVIAHFLYPDELSLGELTEDLVQRLKVHVFESKIWHVTRVILDMPQLTQSLAGDSISLVIFNLIELVLAHVDPESAGGTTEICDSITACLKSKRVGKQLWESFSFYSDNYSSEYSNISNVINNQVRFLPIDVETTFRLLAALASTTGAEQCFDLLNEVKTLSEKITGEETADEIETNDDGSQWISRGIRYIAGYAIDRGTIGEPVESSQGPVVQWNLEAEPVDGWNLVECVLAGNYEPDFTISILKLYSNLKPLEIPIYKDAFEALFKVLLYRSNMLINIIHRL